MPNLTYSYRVFGTPVYSLLRPDHSQVPGPPYFATYTNINETQLGDYYRALHDNIFTVTVATTYDIPAALRNAARLILFPSVGPSPLPGVTPIVDVAVNKSQPTGEPDIWRTATAYVIHPLANIYVPTGINNVTVAPRGPIPNIPNDVPHWVSANVTAFKM